MTKFTKAVKEIPKEVILPKQELFPEETKNELPVEPKEVIEPTSAKIILTYLGGVHVELVLLKNKYEKGGTPDKKIAVSELDGLITKCIDLAKRL